MSWRPVLPSSHAASTDVNVLFIHAVLASFNMNKKPKGWLTVLQLCKLRNSAGCTFNLYTASPSSTGATWGKRTDTAVHVEGSCPALGCIRTARQQFSLSSSTGCRGCHSHRCNHVVFRSCEIQYLTSLFTFATSITAAKHRE